MESNFELGATERLFERIAKDKTGKLKEIVQEVIYRCREMAELDVPIDELATICTMGWHMGSDPELAAMFDYILKQSIPDPQIIN
jgi:hypothetical protein